MQPLTKQPDLFAGFSATILNKTPANPQTNQLPYDGFVHDFGIVMDEPQSLYESLLHSAPWQKNVVTIFGKTHITNRQVVWMGDDHANYHYSGYTHHSIPWTAQMFHVKQFLEQLLQQQGIHVVFNACLLNYYPTGDEGVGYHTDNETELGDQPIIASLSLGATRKFVFKHRLHKEKVEMCLHSGQLIVMTGDTQKNWVHSLPKTKKVHEGRINLTFRYIQQ